MSRLSIALRYFFLGRPKDPLNPHTQKHIALVALLAWIGLGADGLSSACYGPEQAFLALSGHHAIGLLLAIMSAITIFIISIAYNQVIQLFPNGGGGYRVASQLIGQRAGLISGIALIIDYMMTIAISIASGVDAIFSFLPPHYQDEKLIWEGLILGILALINLRGAKESIKLLMPIFLGFFITHMILIIYGIANHNQALPHVIAQSIHQTQKLWKSIGSLGFLAFFMRAYSLGAGTYTGLEAVSNNVNMLASPRVKTGRWTMFYMALSLSLIAGGIMLLYLLWHAEPVSGMTLNAVVFHSLLGNTPLAHSTLIIILLLEAGILFVGANTGFLAGPAVLSNMSLDHWVPKRFSLLSSRLVTQNGIIFFALSALLILLATRGEVSLLVILYSINVFITFSMSLYGLCVYWIKHRQKHWQYQLALSAIALLVCLTILIITVVTKFRLGGWITLTVTALGISVGLLIRRYYCRFAKLKAKLNNSLYIEVRPPAQSIKSIEPQHPTAAFFVNEVGAAMHTLLWAERMFPHYYQNYLFISHGNVDTQSFGSKEKIATLKRNTEKKLNYLIQFARNQGKAAQSYVQFGTEPLEDLTHISEKINHQFPQCLFFASHYIYPKETFINRLLHSGLPTLLQKRLHHEGIKLLILPLNLK